MDDMPLPFELTDTERNSALWGRLRRHLEDLLKDKRGKNDGEQDIIATSTLRGEIKCLKRIISLGDEPPKDG